MSLKIHRIETCEHDVSATGLLDGQPFSLKGDRSALRFTALGRELVAENAEPISRAGVTGALYGFVARLRADSKIVSGAVA